MIKSYKSNLLTVLSSNAVSLLMGLAITFFVPKLIGSVDNYAQWQLYYFYSGFYGLLLFGLNDGMNLLYAGQKYSALDRKKFSAFFAFLCIVMTIITIILVTTAALVLDDPTQRLIVIFTVLSVFLLNVTGFVLHIHQITLRFKDYARINVLEKILFVASFIPMYLLNEKAFMVFIAVNLLARTLTMLYGLSTISDLLQLKFFSFRNIHSNLTHIFQNVQVGFPLTISTILAMLIVTSPRIVVERSLSVYDFGLFSLAFAILSIIVIMISALSTVLYPSLKTKASHNYHRYNSNIRYIITVLCGVAFSFSFAIPKFVDLFLPDYVDITPYIFILVAWVMYQCLGGMLNDVFFRLARLQKSLLAINLIVLIIIFFVQYYALSITGDIKTTVAIGLLVLATWFHLGDIYLHKKNKWQITAYNFIDVPIVVGFYGISNLNTGIIGLATYCVLLLMVLLLSRKKLQDVYKLYKSKSLAMDVIEPNQAANLGS